MSICENRKKATPIMIKAILISTELTLSASRPEMRLRTPGQGAGSSICPAERGKRMTRCRNRAMRKLEANSPMVPMKKMTEAALNGMT